MAGMAPSAIAMFIGSVVFQLIGLWLIPMTKGLTQPLYTLLWAAAMLIGVGFIARLVNSGANMSSVLPLMAAIIPLCTIAMGVFFYGESASAMKIGLLCGSCLLVGVASSL